MWPEICSSRKLRSQWFWFNLHNFLTIPVWYWLALYPYSNLFALTLRAYTACICELQPDSQRWRHCQNSGKRKKLQYFFQFSHFCLFSNKIGADFIQTNSKISFWNDILKKFFFPILKFRNQLLIHIKTKLFFSIKIVQKLKTKKITT